MKSTIDFNEVSNRYEKDSLVQKGASEFLFSLLDIKNNEDVLDVGCGPGNLTKKIRELTAGRVTGADASREMINTALKNYPDDDIEFINQNAQDINFDNQFDVIFCNSTFQWFPDPSEAVAKFYNALRKGGRAGIQAPGGGRYCENFLIAVDEIKDNPDTKEVFTGWKDPFFMPENASDYSQIFIDAGFNITFSEIKTQKAKHTPEEAFNIFSSGAIAAYLNQEYYSSKISNDYIERCKIIIKNNFKNQCGNDGLIELVFRRVYLTGIK